MAGVLRDLSNGISISSVEISKQYEIDQTSFARRLKEIVDRNFSDSVRYHQGLKRWIASETGFLNKEVLEAEEFVILNAILRNKGHLGSSLVVEHEEFVEKYKYMVKSEAFRHQVSEKITETMEAHFVLLKSAIKHNNIVEINYVDKDGVIIHKRLYPFRIYFIEYYWYLIAYEEDKRVKTFRLSHVQDVVLMDEKHEYLFDGVQERLDNAMNAFIDFHDEPNRVEVLVHDRLVEHVNIATFFSAWINTKQVYDIETEEGVTEKFTLFEVKTTNKYYLDIIPTILKYMPMMIVAEPKELKEKINQTINKYQKISV